MQEFVSLSLGEGVASQTSCTDSFDSHISISVVCVGRTYDPSTPEMSGDPVSLARESIPGG